MQKKYIKDMQIQNSVVNLFVLSGLFIYDLFPASS